MRSLKRWLSTHLYYRVVLVSVSAILVINLMFFVFANIQNSRETDRREATLYLLVGHLLSEESEAVVTAYLEHYTHVNGVTIVLLDEQDEVLFTSTATIPTSGFDQVLYDGVPVGSIYADFQRSALGIEYAAGFLILNAVSLVILGFGIGWLKRYLNRTVATLNADLNQAEEASGEFSFQEVADLHEKIRQARSREGHQKELHDALIRSLAHDVKTPLTAALLLLEAMAKKRIDINDDTLQEIAEELRRIESIVPKFIDVERFEEAGLVDLNEYFPAFVLAHKEVFATKQIDVKLALESLVIDISMTDLTRIAEHLIFNAFYYGREKGTIRIRTNAVARVLEIEDDGIGIGLETLERLQNGPYRAPDAVRLHANGHGLGIGIVREIVTRIGAEMEISSTVGQGTTVWIRFR